MALLPADRLPEVQEQGESWLRNWVFCRNGSMSPQQLIVVFVSLSVVSLMVAVIAWDVGGSLVMPFTGIELGSVAIALFVYGRHAADQERVRLSAQQLQVEWENAGVVQTVSFNPQWVRVSLPERGLVEVSSAGKTDLAPEKRRRPCKIQNPLVRPPICQRQGGPGEIKFSSQRLGGCGADA